MSNGKGDQPRPLAVPADEYERRWEATFTPPQPHRFAGAKYIAGRGWLVPCEIPPLHKQYGAGRVVCVGLCDGWHTLAEFGSPQQIASHEPDPSGGRNSDT